MEYGVQLMNYDPPSGSNHGNIANENYYRYVGWEFSDNALTRAFFSDETVKIISKKVTDLLKCTRADNRETVVTDRVITHVMSSVFEAYLPQIGDIYTVFQIPQEQLRDDLKTLAEATVQIITSQIKDEVDMINANQKLTVWTTVLGDHNDHGLRQFSTIKTRKNNINKVRFNMNY